ncbi:MAG: glycosyltransferase family 4 protein, partial [candidate division Zixibacteria bacterium]|nr:glycosyltransferase family 4 protein [candidate division Zixibacteria bacterium]
KDYDIIHIFSASYFSFILAPTPAILISKLYGKKTILNYRSGEAPDHLKKWGWIVIPIIKMVDKIIVPSGFLVDVFNDFGLKADAVSNIVDFADFQFKKREIVKPKLLVTRNLEKLYNISCAIRCFEIVKREFPRAELVIIGYGKDEANLKRLVRELNLNDVRFTGRVEREAIPDYYDKADIFLNSSDIDNMPVSFLEAFSAGLPVVSTDSGGIPYIVEDEYNGFLVKTGDYKALAERIIHLLKNQDQAQKLIQQAKEECKKYTWEYVKEDWFRAYNSLVRDEAEN